MTLKSSLQMSLFLNLEKRNYVNKTVSKFVTDNEIVASQVDILNEIEAFYKSLYSCYDDNLKEVELNSIISSEYYSRLDKNSPSELEGFVSKEEALSALKLRYPTPI